MDFIELIKSRDAKRYLRDIDYKLNILQCAFLVWYQDTNWSIMKKMQAYKYLIDNYEDMPIDTTDYFDGMAKHYDSFKEVLKEIIKRVLSEIKEFLGGCDKNDSTFKGQVKLDDDYQICLSNETSRDEQSKTLYNIFNYMNVSIPTPFKRGDVLQNPFYNTYLHKFNTYYCIDTINTWGTKEARDNGILDPNYRFDRNLKSRLEHGRYDVMMNFDGYAICSYEDRDLDGKKNGVIRKKLTYDFDEWPLLIDLEYADKNELVGYEKLILLVSEYIKTDDKYHKRMDIESILYYYDMIMYEDKHNVRCKSFHEAWNYIDLTNVEQIKAIAKHGIGYNKIGLQGYQGYQLKEDGGSEEKENV